MNLSPKREGSQFEALFERSAHHQDIAILRIQDGCKRIGLKKLIPMKQPCDWIMASNGKMAVIDTKTQASGNTFGYAKLDPNQIRSMIQLANKGCIAGYVIWNREQNKVIFANIKELFLCLELQESFKLKDGIDLGSIEEINFEGIFGADDKTRGTLSLGS